MKLRQERKLNMYFVTSGLIEVTNVSIINQMPQFTTVFDAFKLVATGIKEVSKIQVLHTGGHAVTKANLREDAVSRLSAAASRTLVFAINTADRNLQEIMTFTKSDFERMTVNEVVSNVEAIADQIDPIIESLAEYSITKGMIDDLRAAAAALDASIKKPRAAIVTRKRSTTDIAAMFVEADRLLKLLDKYVAMLEQTEPAFCMDYRNSRMIMDPATRKWSIVGTVTDEQGNPLKDVRVGINGKSTVKTNAKGAFHSTHLKEGEYPVTFALGNYADQAAHATVTNGNRTELNIVLQSL